MIKTGSYKLEVGEDSFLRSGEGSLHLQDVTAHSSCVCVCGGGGVFRCRLRKGY